MEEEKVESWKFETLEYVRPDFDRVRETEKSYAERVRKAENAEEVFWVIFENDEFMKHLTTQCTLAYIRHTLDTRDEFYETEARLIDEKMPELQVFFLEFNEALFESPFRKAVEERFGKKYFESMELQKKRFCEANIPLMQRESVLTDEYQKICASCSIEFRGETLNLYGIQKYLEHEDRAVRKEAFAAFSGFYQAHEEEMERIWDELIAIRNEMGRNLGFENYIPLGYLGMDRTDYGEKEVRSFREQVLQELVPLCIRLYEAQARRLGLPEILVYDESRVFPDGNAVPAGDDDFMIGEARKMYHEISPETGEFIDFMIDHGLMDLKNLPGKAATGYQTDLQDYLAPFVFSCFNGTIGDMQVLTHELGHAFAAYRAMRTQPVSDYYAMSTDICEIHSMAMEQFAYPYAEQFFGEQAEKFRFQHLQNALTFVPYGVCVDEFQHICYARPELTPKERTLEWRKLEKKYMPWRSYDGDEFMERGGFWYYKLHIFLYPFYYINYTLTTMGAMELKGRDAEDHERAWKDYMNLCSCGGSMGYLETLRYANLSDPFEPGSVKRAIACAKDILLRRIGEE